MNCTDAQECFGIYFDLPEDDPRRKQVDEHLAVCPSCREEFELWKESLELIRLAKDETEPFMVTARPVSTQVMDRIYRTESWRMPVSERIYAIPYNLRRNMMAFIAFCLALFMVSFLYNVMDEDSGSRNETASFGFKQAAKASMNAADSLNVHTMARPTLASAGATIIDPVKIGPIKTVPDYLLSLSILGLISTLLIMNWLSRTRA